MWNGRSWVYVLALIKISQTLTEDGRKSQIAIEYAYRFRRSHPQSHVFWVYAMSSGTFVQAYHDIARKLQLPACDDPNTDVCELVSKWLDEEDGHWLMIVDNADKADLFFSSAESDITPATVTGTQRPLIDYLPKIMNSQKSLLITTRSGPVGQDLADGEPGVKVPPFSSQEATELLRLKTKRAVDPFDKHSTERLLDVLGCIPLAITQAAAFMSRNRMTIQSYLADLERNKNLADYLSHELRDHRRPGGFPNSVFRTWKLSFDQILTQEPETAKLLSLIAMLDPQRIPEKLLRPLTERDVDFRTAIGTLSGFALISQDIVGETYSIHPLVQASLHYWLEQSGQKADVAGQALLLLAKEFPAGDYEHKETCELMLAHAQAVLCHECTSDNDIIHRADLLYNVGCFSLEQGRYFSAYREASEAYSIYRTNMGGAANNTLASLSLLASVFESRGNYNEAEKMNRRALKGYEKVLGIEHPDTLTSVNNLAWVLESQGNYNEAEKMNRRALKEREKVLGIEHPDTLISVSNLASVLRYQGNYNEAEKMNRRALKEREKVLGIEHPDTLISVSNLASIFTSQGKYNEAEEMNRRALKAREKVLGIEHPHTLSNFSDLASVLESQRKYNEAEEMNRRALKGYEKVLGIEHPHTLTTVYNFAFLFHTQQRYKDASVLYLRASAGFLKTLGPDHPLTRRCSQKYSDMLCEMEHDNMSDGPNVSSMAKRARQGSQVRDQADREGQGQRRSFAGQLAASKGNDLTEDSTGDGGSERDGKGGSKESNPASTE